MQTICRCADNILTYECNNSLRLATNIKSVDLKLHLRQTSVIDHDSAIKVMSNIATNHTQVANTKLI